MFEDVGAKSGQCSPIESFHLSISLLVVGRRKRFMPVNDLADVSEEPLSELTSVVWGQINR